jgi:ATP/maltotriose-dependent transcriptional regulator MalT/DNA-binding SARP family transcriptional activator
MGPREGPAGTAAAGLLRTRLLPPRLLAACVPRPELVDRVLTALKGRVVTVVAGAGYGKSTLLAQAMAADPGPWVWVSCDERIGSARAFLAHVAAGVAERFPGVGAALELEGSVEEQVAELCNELTATVGDDFVVALDDVHTLEQRPAAEALALLVSDLPPTVHLALASRSALRLPLGHFRAGAVELGEEALAFTEAESAEVLRAARLALSPATVGELHRATEGWAAGLILAAQSGHALLDPARLASGGPSFDYLAEEVFLRQPRDTQDFLLDTALLDRFTPELAGAVTGRPDAGEIVAGLLASHLFTIPLEGGWYRYHHLFHSFLRRRLEGRKAVRIGELHRRAGAGWLAAGEPAEAVCHYLAAGEPGLAVDALEPIAEAMVATPEAETLAGWLNALPEELWSSRPSLVLAQASLLFTRGEYESSYQGMERALEALLAAGEHERAAVAFFRLLQNMIASGTGSPRRLAAGRRYVPRLDPGTRLLPAARVMLAVIYGYSCRLAEAEEELRAALAHPAAADSPVIRAYAEVVKAWYVEYPRGRVEEALAVVTQAIATLERREADDVLGFLAYAHVYRAILLNDLARPGEALVEADRFQEAADRRGMSRVPTRMATWLRLVSLTGLERWGELEARLVSPSEVAPAGESSNFAYRYAVPAAAVAAQRGDATAVARQAAAARREMRDHGPALDQPLALCDLAATALAVGLVDVARDLAVEARLMADAYGLSWWQARAGLLGAVAAGPGTEGDRLLTEALDLTGRLDLAVLWTARERARAGPLLARALARGLGPPGLAARLAVTAGGEVLTAAAEALDGAGPPARAALAEAAGEAVLPELRLVERLATDADDTVRRAAERARAKLEARPRPSVRIVSLGGFSVWRGGLAVPELTTGRQKARTLLAVLLSAFGAVHREKLLDWLWPDLLPERGLATLHSALYALRKMLEPGTGRRAPPTLVVTDGEAYRLALSPGDEWDAAVFSRLAAEGVEPGPLESRVDRLLAAEAAWTGPFLPEWPYEDWAASRRGELDRVHEGVLEALAGALAEAGQPRAAIARWQRLMDLDPEREGWHRALMSAYARAGERALGLRQYHACRTLLRDRLGVDPSPETQALYQALL